MEVSGLISQPFYIEKQESLVSDKFSKNGRTLDLHIVAKNIAFVVHIAAAFDLNLSPPSAKLIYDFDSVEDQREVEGLKNAPLEYTAHVDETGDHNKAAVEVKISVLSSQHEGAYFRIKFSAVDPVTHAVLEEYSQPIKVISKRNQVKRILEKKQPKLAGTENVSSTPIQAVVLSPSKRSSPDSNVAEILTKMEQQQREQLKLLEQLVSKKDVQPIKQQVPVPDPDDMDFETAFHNFLQAYTKIPQEERANKIRRVVKKSGENAVDNLAEFVGIYSGTSRNASGITPAEAFFLNNIDFLDGGCTDKSCKCQECPHKKELSRFDDFYHDFLAEPLSPNGSPEMV